MYQCIYHSFLIHFKNLPEYFCNNHSSNPQPQPMLAIPNKLYFLTILFIQYKSFISGNTHDNLQILRSLVVQDKAAISFHF